MNKSSNYSIKKNLTLKLSVLSTLPILIFGLLFISVSYKKETKKIEELKSTHLTDTKQDLKSQVLNIYNFIEEYDKNLEQNLHELIKNRNGEAFALIEHLYSKYSKTKSTQEVKQIIREALRPLRYHNNQGYYFIVDTKHTEILYPIHPEYEGANLKDLKDAKGTFVIQKEVKLAQTKGEGFVTDHWPKPGSDQSKSFPKISHIKYFKPLKWLVGTGLYLDNFKKSTQMSLLKKISNLSVYNKESNFFLDTDKGVPLVFNGKQVFNQKSLMHLTDPYGVKIYERYLKAAKTSNGDFFEYHWRADPLSKKFSPKISFAHEYKKWNWIFGAGASLDKINQSAEQIAKTMRQELNTLMIQQLLYLLLAILVIFFLVQKMLLKLTNSLTHFTALFHTAVEENTLIDISLFKYKELKDMANSTNFIILRLKQIQNQAEKDKLIQERNARFVSLGEMAGGIAHEINNPLFLIKGHLTLLRKKILPENLPTLDKIDNAVDRITLIIKGFKALTASNSTIKKETIHISDFFKQLKPMIDVPLSKYDVELSLDLCDATIKTDSTLLGQIITNLISNSSYAVKDSKEKWVKIKSTCQNNLLKIKVQDSGLREDIPSPQTIFEPLVTHKAPGDGTGLGLSLSKSITQKLNGELFLDHSEKNTTFVLILKLDN